MAVVEQILQRGPQKLLHHNIRIPLGAHPAHLRYPHATTQVTNHLGFIQQLRVRRTHRFKLYCNLFGTLDVHAQVNVTKGTRAKLLGQLELFIAAHLPNNPLLPARAGQNQYNRNKNVLHIVRPSENKGQSSDKTNTHRL